MLTKQKILVLIIAGLIATPATAKIYKWKDSNGVTQYTATPPPQSATKNKQAAKEVKIRKKPKSSLTYKPKVTQYKDQASTTQTLKKKSKYRKKLSKNSKKDELEKDREECRNASASEKNKIIKQWEKFGKSAVANGRENNAGYKKGMNKIRDVVNNCNF